MIDGVDIKTIGLHTLRKSIAYIPQSPFLLQGTIRENIDPFTESDDKSIMEVLSKVNLKMHIESMDKKLDTIVSESNNLFVLDRNS